MEAHIKEPCFVLSDIHLGSNPTKAIPEREAKLYRFMASLPSESTLVLLGDVFEFWMEYKHYIPKHFFEFTYHLSSLERRGCKIHLLTGNHDFDLGTYFAKYLNLRVHEHSLLLPVQGKKVWFNHGDGMAASGDKAYKILKKVIRNPLSKTLFRLLHPDWGYSLAHWVGGHSRDVNMGKGITQESYTIAARQIMETHDCDVMIQGHTHKPHVTHLPDGRIHANSGQWLFALTYIEFVQGEPVLRTWES
jgi:UDP-2,3-diacylglucosamine hydrolase